MILVMEKYVMDSSNIDVDDDRDEDFEVTSKMLEEFEDTVFEDFIDEMNVKTSAQSNVYQFDELDDAILAHVLDKSVDEVMKNK